MNHVVIMAGGIGSRIWPLSTPDSPKQFIDVLGCGRSLIQLTVDRFKGICPDENFWVVTNEKYVQRVKDHIPFIPESHILAEPAARSTAPCIAWACWSIRQEDPEANVVVTPSDAIVMNTEEFRRVIKNALDFTDPQASADQRIVTIGIKPNRPETGYGYIEPSERIEKEILRVSSFREKPNLETAKEYLADGNYLWNAGIFVWNVRTITSCLEKYKQGIAADMDKIQDTGDVKGIFPQCEKISIDFAVMEPAASEGLVYTHPADFGWSDLGNWQSLYEQIRKDENANGIVGNVTMLDCSDCIVHTEKASKVILQGLEGYIVSEKDGLILVCRRSEEQKIRSLNE